MDAKHAVVFYADDEHRAQAAGDFLAAAHAGGQPLVIIAAEDHLPRLQAELRGHGLDLENDESITMLGARATLDRIVTSAGGRPDAARFERLVGDILVSQHAITGKPPAVYGEMVDLLWRGGNQAAALELEALWDDLLARVPLSLLCGYAQARFSADDGAGFRAVCNAHDQVAPLHLYERLREVETAVLAGSKDELVAFLGHELRNPLAPMLTALELIRRKGGVDRECDTIERQVHQMARVVDALIEEMLPRIFEPSQPLRRARRAVTAPALALVPDALRVLVIDDNQDAADTLAEILGDAGHTVAVAYDAPGALEVARQRDVDVAVVDLGLPGMDGYELAPHLRKLAGPRPLRLLALTGYGQEKDRARSEAAGFDLHLTKPVSIMTLLAALSG